MNYFLLILAKFNKNQIVTLNQIMDNIKHLKPCKDGRKSAHMSTRMAENIVIRLCFNLLMLKIYQIMKSMSRKKLNLNLKCV